MSPNKQQALLTALKAELKFSESGGYKEVHGRLPARASENDPMATHHLDASRNVSQKQISVFRDSPLCLNYGLSAREHPCSECCLIEFVPSAKRGEAFPCHHIPLNERGDSVATLGGPGDTREVHEAVVDWLRRMIKQLEGAAGQSQSAKA